MTTPRDLDSETLAEWQTLGVRYSGEDWPETVVQSAALALRSLGSKVSAGASRLGIDGHDRHLYMYYCRGLRYPSVTCRQGSPATSACGTWLGKDAGLLDQGDVIVFRFTGVRETAFDIAHELSHLLHIHTVERRGLNDWLVVSGWRQENGTWVCHDPERCSGAPSSYPWDRNVDAPSEDFADSAAYMLMGYMKSGRLPNPLRPKRGARPDARRRHYIARLFRGDEARTSPRRRRNPDAPEAGPGRQDRGRS